MIPCMLLYPPPPVEPFVSRGPARSWPDYVNIINTNIHCTKQDFVGERGVEREQI